MKYLLFFAFLLLGTTVFAQDQIILRSGEAIQGKVTELTPEYIKYKRHGHIDGPTVSVERAKVFMINYENGIHEVVTALDAAPKPEPAPTEPSVNAYTRSSSPTREVARKPRSNRSRNAFDTDDLQIQAGLSLFPGNFYYEVGGFAGVERTWYFQPSLGWLSHVSLAYVGGSYQDYYNDISSGVFVANFMGGLKVRSSDAPVRVYGSALIGSAWASFTGDAEALGEAWRFGGGGNVGMVIQNQIDLNARVLHYFGGEGVLLQIGAGYHF